MEKEEVKFKPTGFVICKHFCPKVCIQFSHSVVSDSLRPHGLQHTRHPCPSLTPGAYLNSCPSSWWCHPPSHSLSSPSPPSFNLSQHQGLFQWLSSSHQVAKVLELQLQYQSFQWIFRVDLLAVQGTLKSLIQHHRSKASILWHSAFFTVQLSHPYMTTGRTIAFTMQTFVGKAMPLLCNTLSLAFLLRSKCLLISCLQS